MYKSDDDDNTTIALVFYSEENLEEPYNTVNIYDKLNTLMENKIFLSGYLNIYNFKKCYNKEQNSWIFITITEMFKPLSKINNYIDINKLKILSNQLNDNNTKDIYFFNKNINIDDFVISSNNDNYLVYIEDFDKKAYNDFGIADSCAMYKILSLHNGYDRNIKRELNGLYLTCYNKLTDKQKQIFDKDYGALL
jgi:hypothetical protein